MNQLADCSLTTVAPALAAFATIAAVLVALFRDSILVWWRRPELKAWVNPNPPHCHATEMEFPDGVRHPVYWFMLWVGNRGRGRAEKVQVFADKLEREGADGWFHRVEKFMPMNLRWSHGGGTFLDGISPRMGQHCNLGYVGHPAAPGRPGSVPVPKVWFALDTELKSFTNSHLLEPGKYKLWLKIAAANAKPVSLTIGLTITGDWFDQQSEMFSKGIGLRICH